MENTNKNEVAKKEITQSERFSQMVVREFTSNIGETGATGLTAFQKRLCQNYFIKIDMALKDAEIKRAKKNAEKLPVTWENVNLPELAVLVVASAKVGLDPSQPNHINMMPFKDNNNNKYSIVFMPGYRGMELKAKKYGLEIPNDVIVELVYSTDKFKPLKKDVNNKIESYEFVINDPNNRGEIVGGFYYYVFDETPRKNKLIYLTIEQILKRKPKYASPEFWGGEKDEWEDGRKTGKKIKIEGWYDEMCWKTVARSAYGNITIDPQKIDDDFQKLLENEMAHPQSKELNDANTEEITFDVIDIKEEPKQELKEESKENTPKTYPVPDEQEQLTPGF